MAKNGKNGKDEEKKQTQEQAQAATAELKAQVEADAAAGALTTSNDAGPAEVAATVPYETGMEDVGREDLVIPRMSLVQPTSDSDEKGKFLINLTEEAKSLVHMVLLKLTKGRVYFDKKDLNAEHPICGSGDRKVPAPFFTNEEPERQPMNAVCEGCVSAEWGDKGEPPPCAESYTLLGMDTAEHMPFFIAYKGMAIKAVKMLLTMVQLKLETPKHRKLQSMACDFSFEMTSQKKENKKGKFYIPVFKKLTYLEDTPYRDEFAAYGHQEAGFEPEKKEEEESGETPA